MATQPSPSPARREVRASATSYLSPDRPRSWRGRCRCTIFPRRRRAPRVDATFMSLENRRAQGIPGARCTRGLVCKIVRKTHTSIQVQRRHSGIPCAMVLRLMARSSRRRIRLATVIGELTVLSSPVGLDKTSADLTPATGAGTTRFCRTLWRRRLARRLSLTGKTRPATPFAPTLPRPPHLNPRFVTIVTRPSSRVRRAETCADLPDKASEKFCREGLDRFS